MKKIGYVLRPILIVLVTIIVIAGVVFSYDNSSTNETPKNYDVEFTKTNNSVFSFVVFDENGETSYDKLDYEIIGNGDGTISWNSDNSFTVTKEGDITFLFTIYDGTNVYQVSKSVYLTDYIVSTYGEVVVNNSDSVQVDHADIYLGGRYDVIYNFGAEMDMIIEGSSNPYNDGIIRIIDNDTFEVVGVGDSTLAFVASDGTKIVDQYDLISKFHSAELEEIVASKFVGLSEYRQSEFEEITEIDVDFYSGLESDLSFLKNINKLTLSNYPNDSFNYDIPYLEELKLNTTNFDFDFVDSNYSYLEKIEFNQIDSLLIINEGVKDVFISNSASAVTISCDTLESITIGKVDIFNVENALNLSKINIIGDAKNVSIANTSNLIQLNLSDAKLELIELSNNANLKKVNVSNNPFVSFNIESLSLDELNLCGCPYLSTVNIDAPISNLIIDTSDFDEVNLINVQSSLDSFFKSNIEVASFVNCSNFDKEVVDLSNMSFNILTIDGGNLTELNLSKSSKTTSLYTETNITINLSNLTQLRKLGAANLGLSSASINYGDEGMIKNLEELDLQGNNLSEFDPNIYQALKILNISNNVLVKDSNNISEFNLLSTSNLEKVNIDNTGINKIISNTAKLKELSALGVTEYDSIKISSPLIVFGTNATSVNTLELSNLECDMSGLLALSTNYTSLKNCSYINKEELDLSDLGFVQLYLSDLNKVEKLIIKKFAMQLFGNVSSEIDMISINQMSNLTDLSLIGTGLNHDKLSIDSNILNNLVNINFELNNFTYFDFNLPNLKQLDLSYNAIKNINITTVSNIESLDLYSNNLAEVNIISNKLNSLNINGSSKPVFDTTELLNVSIDAPIANLVMTSKNYDYVSLKNISSPIDNLLTSTVETAYLENISVLNEKSVSLSFATKYLKLVNQEITSLAISGNLLEQFVLDDIDGLTTLKVNSLQLSDGNLNISTEIKNNLVTFEAQNNKFSEFDLTGFNCLSTLKLDNNNIVDINLSEIKDTVTALYLTGNQLSGTFNFTGYNSLDKLYLDSNMISGLTIDGTNVSVLNLNDNLDEFGSLVIKNTNTLMSKNFSINSTSFDEVYFENVKFEFEHIISSPVDKVSFINCSYLNSSNVSLNNSGFIYNELNLSQINRNNLILSQEDAVATSKVKISEISNLRVLKISNIDLGNLNFIDTNSVSNLLELTLENCNLTSYHYSNFPTVTSLVLSRNSLNSLIIKSNVLNTLNISDNDSLDHIVIDAPITDLTSNLGELNITYLELRNIVDDISNIYENKVITSVIFDNCSYLNDDTLAPTSTINNFDFTNIKISNLSRKVINLSKEALDDKTRSVILENIDGLTNLSLQNLGLNNSGYVIDSLISNSLLELNLSSNQLTSLDFSLYQNIEKLLLANNSLIGEINTICNPKLQELNLENNRIESIISKNKTLTTLNLLSCPNLTKIVIDEPVTTLSTNFGEDKVLENVELTSVVANILNILCVDTINNALFDGCTYLEEDVELNIFDFDKLTISNISRNSIDLSRPSKSSKLRSLSLINIDNLYKLNINNLGVATLGNISKLKSIKELKANNNNLISIDLELFSLELSVLELNNNLIDMELDLSNYTKLNTLNVYGNKFSKISIFSDELSNLDIASNTSLRELDIYSNSYSGGIAFNTLTALTSVKLDIPNTNSGMDLSNNMNLNIININCPNIDTIILPSVDQLSKLHVVAMCDIDISVIKNEILDLSLDSLLNIIWPNDGVNVPIVKLSNMNTISTVNLSGNNVSSLSLVNLDGITNLNLSHNSLLSFEIVNLDNLETLDLSYNKLTEFTFENIPNLITLNISNNDISTITYGVEEFSKLSSMDLSGNKISNLVIGSQFPVLTDINLLNNEVEIELFSLDGQMHLETIDFSGTSVKKLSVSNCSQIQSINLPASEEIIFKNNENLVNIGYNPLPGSTIKNLVIDNAELANQLNIDLTSVISNISSIEKLELTNMVIVNNSLQVKELKIEGNLPDIILDNIGELEVFAYYYISSSTDSSSAELKNLKLRNLNVTQFVTNYSFESLEFDNCAKINNINFINSSKQEIKTFNIFNSLVSTMALGSKLNNIDSIENLSIIGYSNEEELDLSSYSMLVNLELINIESSMEVKLAANDFENIELDNCSLILNSFVDSSNLFKYKTESLTIKNVNLEELTISSISSLNTLIIDNLSKLKVLEVSTSIENPNLSIQNVDIIEEVSIDAAISNIDNIDISNVKILTFNNTIFENLDLRKENSSLLSNETDVTAYYNNLTELTINQNNNVGNLTLANFDNDLKVMVNAEIGMQKLIIDNLNLSDITFDASTILNFDVKTLSLNNLSSLNYLEFINTLEYIESISIDNVYLDSVYELNIDEKVTSLVLNDVYNLESIVYSGITPINPLDFSISGCDKLYNINIKNREFSQLNIDLDSTISNVVIDLTNTNINEFLLADEDKEFVSELYLADNNILSFDINNYPNLRVLNLQNNNINSFSYENNSILEELYLLGNENTELFNLNLNNLPNLNKLSISNDVNYSDISLIDLPLVTELEFNQLTTKNLIINNLAIINLDLSGIQILSNLSLIDLNNLNKISLDDSELNGYSSFVINNVNFINPLSTKVDLNLEGIASLNNLSIVDSNVFNEIKLTNSFSVNANELMLMDSHSSYIYIDALEIDRIYISNIESSNYELLNITENVKVNEITIEGVKLSTLSVGFTANSLNMNNIGNLANLYLSSEKISKSIELDTLVDLATLTIDTTSCLENISIKNSNKLQNLYLSKDKGLLVNNLELNSLGNDNSNMFINDTNNLIVKDANLDDSIVIFDSVNISTIILSSYYDFINNKINKIEFINMKNLYDIKLENMYILKNVSFSTCGTSELIDEAKHLVLENVSFELGSETDEIVVLDGLDDWNITLNSCSNTATSYVFALNNISKSTINMVYSYNKLNFVIKPYKEATSINNLNIKLDAMSLNELNIDLGAIGINNLSIDNKAETIRTTTITANENTNVAFAENSYLGDLVFENNLNSININNCSFTKINTNKFNYLLITEGGNEIVKLLPLSESKQYDQLSSKYVEDLELIKESELTFNVTFTSDISSSYPGYQHVGYKYYDSPTSIDESDITTTSISGYVKNYSYLFNILWSAKDFFVTFINEDTDFEAYFETKTLTFNPDNAKILDGTDFTYIDMIKNYEFRLVGNDSIKFELPQDYDWSKLPMDLFDNSDFTGFDVSYTDDGLSTIDKGYYVSVNWKGLNIEYYCSKCDTTIYKEYFTMDEIEANPEITIYDGCNHTGYNFVGWKFADNIYDVNSKHYLQDVKDPSSYLIKFEAVFEGIDFMIDFEENGGEECVQVNVVYDQVYNLPSTSRTGYTFDGWYLDSSLTNKLGNAGDEYINLSTIENSTVTLYAKWKINQYTITFVNTGDTTIASITQNYGTAITAPSNPSKTGHTFTGWSPSIPSTMPAENMTITATWKINQYTITFDSNGGTSVASITQNYGTAITKPSNPTRSGHKFIGWDKTIPSTMPAENMTITAKWQACITYDTLILMADGTEKYAKDVKVGDYIMTWNLFTGENCVTQVFVIEKDGYWETQINTLVFSDGTSVDTASEHGFFNITLGKFVYFTDDSGSEYIGHEFMKTIIDEFGNYTYDVVVLEDYIQEIRYEGLCSIVTAHHLSHYANGLLSIGGGIEGLFNIFEIDDDMKYDEEKMAADIEKYGLFTYEDFADVATEEEFEAVNAKYFKVAIGKGILTMEQIHSYIQRFLRGE